MRTDLGQLLNLANQTSQKKQGINDEIKHFTQTIFPLEFESYFDFYNINNFKKGYSESGVVDVHELKRREHGVYYQKISRNGDDGSSNLGDEDPDADEIGNAGSDEDGDFETKNEKKNKKGKVGKSKKLPEPQVIRRSSRLSKKELENNKKLELEKKKEQVLAIQKQQQKKLEEHMKSKQVRKNKQATQSDDAQGLERIFENLVEKIPQPSRRSDMILPTKYRFVPEKTQGLKPNTDKLIKYHKLVQHKKISSFLTNYKKNGL
ncbi:hypothetical protein ACO0RG_002960 [Hanseniaspora osmophila]